VFFLVSGEDRQVPVYASGIQVSLDRPQLLIFLFRCWWVSFPCVSEMVTKIPTKMTSYAEIISDLLVVPIIHKIQLFQEKKFITYRYRNMNCLG